MEEGSECIGPTNLYSKQEYGSTCAATDCTLKDCSSEMDPDPVYVYVKNNNCASTCQCQEHDYKCDFSYYAEECSALHAKSAPYSVSLQRSGDSCLKVSEQFGNTANSNIPIDSNGKLTLAGASSTITVEAISDTSDDCTVSGSFTGGDDKGSVKFTLEVTNSNSGDACYTCRAIVKIQGTGIAGASVDKKCDLETDETRVINGVCYKCEGDSWVVKGEDDGCGIDNIRACTMGSQNEGECGASKDPVSGETKPVPAYGTCGTYGSGEVCKCCASSWDDFYKSQERDCTDGVKTTGSCEGDCVASVGWCGPNCNCCKEVEYPEDIRECESGSPNRPRNDGKSPCRDPVTDESTSTGSCGTYYDGCKPVQCFCCP